jgi:hypothetical protein
MPRIEWPADALSGELGDAFVGYLDDEGALGEEGEQLAVHLQTAGAKFSWRRHGCLAYLYVCETMKIGSCGRGRFVAER